jgi:hypothetical protein
MMEMHNGIEDNQFEYYFRFKKTGGNFDKLWRMKGSARQSLREWLLAIHTMPKMAEVIANSAGELIENCIKYSDMNTFSFVSIRVDGNVVKMETGNKADPELTKSILQLIDQVRMKKQTLAEIYVEKIKECLTTGKSQLGLIKILLETNGALELLPEEDQHNVHIKVTVTVK